MIAVIGYPGEQRHTWKRFAAKSDASDWLESTVQRLCEMHPAASAHLRMSARIVSEKDAAKARYRDERRCYPRDPEAEYYAEVIS